MGVRLPFKAAVIAVGLAAAPSVQAATYVIAFNGTLVGAYDNVGMFGAANTNLSGKAFTATYTLVDPTPGAVESMPNGYTVQYAGSGAGTPLTATLTVNGITRGFQTLSGSAQVVNDQPVTHYDALGLTVQGDQMVGNLVYDDFMTIYLKDDSQSMFSSFDLPDAFSTAITSPFTATGYYRFKIGPQTQGTGQFGITSVTITKLASAVPEPASWAIMIAGFGIAGMAMRQRRAAVRFA